MLSCRKKYDGHRLLNDSPREIPAGIPGSGDFRRFQGKDQEEKKEAENYGPRHGQNRGFLLKLDFDASL